MRSVSRPLAGVAPSLLLLSHLVAPCLLAGAEAGAGEGEKDPGLQLMENPPMQLIMRAPPPPAPVVEEFEISSGYTLIETLDDFRAAIRRSGQKIRMKPGVYRARKTDPPMEVPVSGGKQGADGRRRMKRQEHIFAVNGSNNHFDLRGVVLETPVSVQSTLSARAHVSDSWHINGASNTFVGGYFRNVVDMPYPNYQVTENEFEICNDGNTFSNCVFVIKGSVPFGYTDFYGKGGPNYGRLNKHSFMGITSANDTRLVGCQVYLQSFGHCIYFNDVDGVLIEDCFFTGVLRPTRDIYRETVGRARGYGFNMMYRSKQPIPKDQMIPLTEDGIRAYSNVGNITVLNTTVERMRGCFQLLCVGDVTLDNVTVREAGDFGFDVSSGDRGRVVMRNCRSDVAYNPVFNLTRGETPKDGLYEVILLSPPEGAEPTPRTGLGVISGDHCRFVLRDRTTRPLPPQANRLVCGGAKGMRSSTVENHTTATLILDRNVRECVIKSVGPVEDHGRGNSITRLDP